VSISLVEWCLHSLDTSLSAFLRMWATYDPRGFCTHIRVYTLPYQHLVFLLKRDPYLVLKGWFLANGPVIMEAADKRMQPHLHVSTLSRHPIGDELE
jgi:hypothetical protein